MELKLSLRLANAETKSNLENEEIRNNANPQVRSNTKNFNYNFALYWGHIEYL
jgi:hypothetical protein